jgi:hypothetical protein
VTGPVECEVRVQDAPPDRGDGRGLPVGSFGPGRAVFEAQGLPRPGDLVQLGPDVVRVLAVLHRAREWSGDRATGGRRAGVVLLCFWAGGVA